MNQTQDSNYLINQFITRPPWLIDTNNIYTYILCYVYWFMLFNYWPTSSINNSSIQYLNQVMDLSNFCNTHFFFTYWFFFVTLIRYTIVEFVCLDVSVYHLIIISGLVVDWNSKVYSCTILSPQLSIMELLWSLTPYLSDERHFPVSLTLLITPSQQT